MPKSGAQRIKELRERRKKAGLVDYRQAMTPKHRVSMKAYYKTLIKGATNPDEAERAFIREQEEIDEFFEVDRNKD